MTNKFIISSVAPFIENFSASISSRRAILGEHPLLNLFLQKEERKHKNLKFYTGRCGEKAKNKIK